MSLSVGQPSAAGAASETIKVYEKATGAEIGSVEATDAAGLAEAILAARSAQGPWSARSGHARAWTLRRAAAELERRRDDVLDLVIRETGGIRRKAAYEVDASIDEMHAAAALAMGAQAEIFPSSASGRLNIVQRVPMGVVGVITPWNFPFILAIRAVAPALALGNAVILKPSSETPIVGGRIVAEIFGAAGAPPDILRVVPGPGATIGEGLATSPHVDMLHFTGSSVVGDHLAVLATKTHKRISFELGGNNAYIVLDDADPDLACAAGAWSAFYHAGQMCVGAGRHIVARRVADRYIELLAARARALRVGDPADPATEVGPIVNRSQWTRIMADVAESRAMGALVVAGGDGSAPFIQPTVLRDVSPDMPAWRNELFGPVAPVLVVDSDEEAIAVANDTPYGLSSAIFTGDAGRGYDLAQSLQTGMVHVNGPTTIDEAHMPFGGCKGSGYGGRSGGEANLEEFTQRRWVSVQRSLPSISDFVFAYGED